MAILVYNKCPICGKDIDQSHKVIMFPAFVSNKLDPLWIFSDSVLHFDCFKNHPLAVEIQNRYNEFLEKNNPNNRFCVVCKNKITNPDDYFNTGHLTNDSNEQLYNYNYLHFHESCLKNWSLLKEYYGLVKEYKENNAWEGDGLNNLLSKLESIIFKS